MCEPILVADGGRVPVMGLVINLLLGGLYAYPVCVCTLLEPLTLGGVHNNDKYVYACLDAFGCFIVSSIVKRR